MDQKGLVELGELALDEAGADDVNDPHFDVLGGDLQGAGDLGVGDGAGLGGGGDGGEGEEAHFAVEDGVFEALVFEPARVLVGEVVVVVQELHVDDFKELEVFRVGLAEGLDGVDGGEVLEVEVGGVGEGGFEGADAEVAGVGLGDFVGGNGAQGAEEVEVCFCRFAGFVGDVGNAEVEFALVFFVCFPGLNPAVQVFELWP